MPVLPQGKHCCGCSACFSACPHDSITMVQDFEGFYYPSVDSATCTECKSCEVACPTLPFLDLRHSVKKISRFPYDIECDRLDSRGVFVRSAQSNASFFDTDSLTDSAKTSQTPATNAIFSFIKSDSAPSGANFTPPPPPYCLALKAKDTSLRENSSSGGVFSLLALDVLSRGGVVFGAGYDENLRVIHKAIHSPDELDSLRRSKYVESFIGESFKQAKAYLKEGKLVLFSGVQCQIHGLHSFLKKPYANLLTLEVICNSVPSPKVFEIYKQSLLEEDDEVVLDVNFRGKNYGWGKGEFAIKTKTKTKTKTLPHSKVPFMGGFLCHFITRPSCENCYAKGFKSGADITLGDYWGVHIHHPEFNDTSGVTCALIHSRQGAAFMESIADSMEVLPSSFENILSGNLSLIKSHKSPTYPFISRANVLRNVLETYERELQANKPIEQATQRAAAQKATQVLERALRLNRLYNLPSILLATMKCRAIWIIAKCLPRGVKDNIKALIKTYKTKR